MRAQRSAAVRIFSAAAWVAGSPCSSSSTARATTTDSGLLSSWATPASSEPSAASFSRWYSDSRCRASSSAERFFSVMSRAMVSTCGLP